MLGKFSTIIFSYKKSPQKLGRIFISMQSARGGLGNGNGILVHCAGYANRARGLEVVHT